MAGCDLVLDFDDDDDDDDDERGTLGFLLNPIFDFQPGQWLLDQKNIDDVPF